jgi:3-deoxy-D-manno-octulosonic-acid transferase
VQVSFLPYDFPGAVQRFLEHFRPRLGVIMETEVWPNLLAGCAASRVPVLLANARMSEKSARGYARWKGLTQPAFASLAAVCAQSIGDAERLRALGAPRVEVTGNLKFDVAPDAQQLAAGRAWRAALGRPVLLLASTRDGEEKVLLDSLRMVRDTMGEMAFYFAASDVAVIGGSFVPLGGQNLIEAVAAGTPVITGPSMFNFAEATRLAVAAGAAIQVSDAQQAFREAGALLGDAARRSAMSEAGKKFCEQHRGATERHLALCLQLVASGR